MKLLFTIITLLLIISWCKSRPEPEPKPKKKIIPDTDVERWRKEMVKHWR